MTNVLIAYLRYPILVTVTLKSGEVRYIAAKSQLAGLALAHKSFPKEAIKKINVSSGMEV